MNKIILTGRLVRDAELGFIGSTGTPKMAFSIAVDRKFKRDDEPEVDFINIKAFGKTAEFIQKFFSKGRRIGIEGRINTGSYVNKDQQKVYFVEVIAENVEFVDNAPAKTAASIDIDNIPDDIAEELPWS